MRRIHYKKPAAVLAALVLTTALLAGCGSTAATTPIAMAAQPSR